jgi:hypothetical protein
MKNAESATRVAARFWAKYGRKSRSSEIQQVLATLACERVAEAKCCTVFDRTSSRPGASALQRMAAT